MAAEQKEFVSGFAVEDRDIEHLADLIAGGRTSDALHALRDMFPSVAPYPPTAIHLAALRDPAPKLL